MKLFRKATPVPVVPAQPTVDQALALLAADRAAWACTADVRRGATTDTVVPQAYVR